MPKIMSKASAWRRLAASTLAVVAALAALLAMSAAKLQCSNEAGSPQKAPAVTHAAVNPTSQPIFVLVHVGWLKNDQKPDRKVEIAITRPGKKDPGTPVVIYVNRNGQYEVRFAMSPGDRVSVTADQDQGGFLQCWIKHDIKGGKFLDEEHRNDGGSTHCEWTRPVTGLG